MSFPMQRRFYYVAVGIKSAVVPRPIDLLRTVEGDHFEFVQSVQQEVFVEAELCALDEYRRFVPAYSLVFVDRVADVALVDLDLLRHRRVDDGACHVTLQAKPSDQIRYT